MAVVNVIVGLLGLFLGAEMLVRGASGLAQALRMPPLIIGLTVVAFGTSAPELAVAIKSAMSGQGDIALGSVLGSNTFNVLCILGLSALITPLAVSSQLVRLDVPVMIGVSAGAWLLALDGAIGRVDGVLMVSAVLLYTAVLIRSARGGDGGDGRKPVAVRRGSGLGGVVLMIAGLALLAVGSDRLVGGAVSLARMLGLSELVIALTLIAAGTSMPEVATSILAAVRGQRDLAVGNVVGTNIINLLAVLGSAAVVSGEGLAVPPAALAFDFPVMLAVAMLCLPIFFTGGRISRWEAVLLLCYYGGYVLFLILSAKGHPTLSTFRAAMVWFFIPMSVIAVALSVAAAVSRRREAQR